MTQNRTLSLLKLTDMPPEILANTTQFLDVISSVNLHQACQAMHQAAFENKSEATTPQLKEYDLLTSKEYLSFKTRFLLFKNKIQDDIKVNPMNQLIVNRRYGNKLEWPIQDIYQYLLKKPKNAPTQLSELFKTPSTVQYLNKHKWLALLTNMTMLLVAMRKYVGKNTKFNHTLLKLQAITTFFNFFSCES